MDHQWAASGYQGAIRTGKTICGFLFGGAVFLGYLHGRDALDAPGLQNEGRVRAIESVRGLFENFLERFGETDCRTLTGCDWSKEEDRDRYMRDQVYKDTCFKYWEAALSYCLEQVERIDVAR